MALGLCCEWVDVSRKNLLVSRTLQLGRFNRGEYSNNLIKQCYLNNLNNLKNILPTIYNSGIRFFRISSSMFPLFDKVSKELYDNEEVLVLLQAIGKFITDNNMRVNTHPGQFVVISSHNKQTVENSVREMNFHGWMFDQMRLPRSPYYNINIHGGKSDSEELLITNIELLNESARSRMTLENDEFSYSLAELQFISYETGIPLVYDSHHHSINSGDLTHEEAIDLALSTWPSGIKATTHLSNSCPEYKSAKSLTKRRIHSDYIDSIPEAQAKAHQSSLIDIEVEAKAKNLAIFEMVKQTKLSLI